MRTFDELSNDQLVERLRKVDDPNDHDLEVMVASGRSSVPFRAPTDEVYFMGLGKFLLVVRTDGVVAYCVALAGDQPEAGDYTVRCTPDSVVVAYVPSSWLVDVSGILEVNFAGETGRFRLATTRMTQRC